MTFDLNLFSMTYADGHLQSELPPFYAASAIKRAARGRQEDALIILLNLKGDNPLPQDEQKDWLEKLSNQFFKTSGSVTSAMRTVIDSVNNALMERNLKIVSDHDRLSADLSVAVIHHDTLFVAQCGVIHAFLVEEGELTHFFDPDSAGRGLGLSLTANVRFFQHVIQNGDYFIASLQSPETWTSDNMHKDGKLTFGQLWRRLHNQIPPDHFGGLVQILDGQGVVTLAHGSQPAAPEKEPEQPVTQPKEPSQKELQPESLPPTPLPSAPQEAKSQEEDDSITSPENATQPGLLPTQEAVAPTFEELAADSTGLAAEQSMDEEPLAYEELQPDQQPAPRPINGKAFYDNRGEEIDFSAETPAEIQPQTDGTQPLEETPPTGQSVTQPSQLTTEPEPQRQAPKVDLAETKQKIRTKGMAALSAFFKWTHKVSDKTKTFFTDIKVKLFPSNAETPTEMSKGTMLIITIIVPLLIVALAASVYLSRGRNRQYDYLFAQAQAAADNAQLITSPELQRTNWEQVLSWADQAAEYRQTEDINQIIWQAQNALDALDGAIRLAYNPAISGELPADFVITEIIPITNDLYLLDETAGRVLYLTRGNRGYVVDTSFVCSAGTYEGITVGNLVEMDVIPINNAFKAPIMAMDANGNLLYCAPGKQPVARTLIAPDSGWGSIQGMAVDSGKLFVLDPDKNALWVYYGSASEFITVPSSFFNGFPLTLTNAADLAVNTDELYLLFNDGSLAICLAPGFEFSSITCTNPAPFQDPRTDAPPLDLPDLQFSQVLFTSPRDPSVMLLAPTHGDLYQFSAHLTLNRIYRPNLTTSVLKEQAATAFTISADRNAFLALGNQLFMSLIP